MKERGIIFSAPMVRALLAGQKTQTRRIVKPQPSPATAHPQCSPMARYLGDACHSIMWYTPKPDGGTYIDRDENSPWRCPYGQPGDRLWVRETWFEEYDPETVQPLDPPRALYRATETRPVRRMDGSGFTAENKDGSERSPWRSPLHMPRWASRLTLEVVGIRIERLHEITDGDVAAEGITGADADPVDVYMALWEQLHGAGSWAGNPWVWVIEFRRVTP